jgi:anti-anti-sigma factor
MANHDDVLRVTVEPLDHDVRLIRAVGEIDMSSVAALRRELDAARVEAVTVVLDLSGVTFIDSSGLHLLLRASDSSAGSDRGFSMVRPSKSVLRLIELSGTADVLTVIDPTAERVSADAGIR